VQGANGFGGGGQEYIKKKKKISAISNAQGDVQKRQTKAVDERRKTNSKVVRRKRRQVKGMRYRCSDVRFQEEKAQKKRQDADSLYIFLTFFKDCKKHATQNRKCVNCQVLRATYRALTSEKTSDS
jgi:hypothetical protein